jgi:type IV pilus assembly protein PilV
MSLVEVLVALVVLSVGMLGVAVLFVQSVGSSRTAIYRTQAVNLVSDMADRIRANANAGSAYDLATYAGSPSLHNCAPTDPAGNTGNNCSVAQLAEDDLARWQQSVQFTLPEPTASSGSPPANVQYVPSGTPNAPDRYRITVSWQEPGRAAGAPPLTYRADVVLMPRPAVVAAARP